MALYYYTPVFIVPPSEGNPYGSIEPGELDSDDVTIIDSQPPLGTSAPKYDDVAERFVLVCPDGTTPPNGWVEKTKAEVNSDYPGLIP